jgi:hypothetical protein
MFDFILGIEKEKKRKKQKYKSYSYMKKDANVFFLLLFYVIVSVVLLPAKKRKEKKSNQFNIINKMKKYQRNVKFSNFYIMNKNLNSRDKLYLHLKRFYSTI